MFPGNEIQGPGYSVQLPPGFTCLNGMPALGTYWLMPPGVTQFDVQALVQIRPVNPFELQPLLQNLYSFDNLQIAQMNAYNLGLGQVLGIMPGRQMQMPQGLTHIREFDAVTLRGFPVRVMEMVMQGAMASVEVVVMMNLYRWTQFVAPCLDFVGRINLAGTPQAIPQLRAVMDQNRTDQIEYQFVTPGSQPVSVTSLPTNVGGTTIIHIDTLIQTRDINGTEVAIGPHSTAAVQAGQPAAGNPRKENAMDGKDSSITTGNITGGPGAIAIGPDAQATVNINPQMQGDILQLLALLREQVGKSDLPDSAKNVLLNRAVPEMEKGVSSGSAKPALEHGLERINDQLEGAGAAAKNVAGIVETISKIAGVVGIAVKTVAPFLAGLL
jgi:hypothetical protein